MKWLRRLFLQDKDDIEINPDIKLPEISEVIHWIKGDELSCAVGRMASIRMFFIRVNDDRTIVLFDSFKEHKYIYDEDYVLLFAKNNSLNTRRVNEILASPSQYQELINKFQEEYRKLLQ